MNARREYYLLFLPLVIWLCAERCGGQTRSDSSESLFASSPSTAFFIQNKGQWPSEARYMTRLGGMNAWITDRGIVYDFYRILSSRTDAPRPTDLPSSFGSPLFSQSFPERTTFPEPVEQTGHVVAMEFVGGRGRVVAEEGTKQPAYHNYFIGKDRSKWVGNVPLYGEVRLKEVYPGIDALLRFDEGSMRYDLHVAAGADPSQIRMIFVGAEEIDVNDKGELALQTRLGEILHGSLFAYQELEGERRRVECAFSAEPNGAVGFALGEYDRRYPLVIDPLIYATMLGGTDYGGWGNGELKVDDDGNVYTLGHATTGTFPTTPGAYDRVFANSEIVVIKLNRTGTGVFYSTFVGGIGRDQSKDIALDKEGNVYVTGWTSWMASATNDFPVTPGAFDTARRRTDYADAFAFKLNDDGTALIYSTFLAGDLSDDGVAIAVDNDGNAFVAGVTTSRNYPVTAGVFGTVLTDTLDWTGTCFITKLNATGSALLYSTYLGGRNFDVLTDIVVDAGGYAYVTGNTQSADFPSTSGAYDPTFNGDTIDAFAAKLNQSGSGLVYSTFLGGTKFETATCIGIDSVGNAYVAGTASSVDFPTTPNTYSRQRKGWVDGFITKLNTSGTALVYSTFIGGGDDIDPLWVDGFSGIAIDGDRNAVVVGRSSSSDYPLSTSPKAVDAVINAPGDAVLTKLNAAGSGILYSTYFGDADGEAGVDVAFDPAGYIYMGGSAARTNDFPATPGAYDSLPASANYKGFIAKLRITCMMKANVGADTVLCAEPLLQLKTDIVDGDGPYTYSWEPSSWLDDPTSRNPIAEPKASVDYIVTVVDDEGCVAKDTIRVRVLDPLTVELGADVIICSGDSIRIGERAVGGEGPYRYQWEPALGLSQLDIMQPKASPTETTTYRVVVVDARGCTVSDSIVVTVLRPPTPVITVVGSTTLCEGDSVTLDAGNGYSSYNWSNGAMTRTVRLGTSGQYSVEVTNGFGCAGTSPAVDVRVNPLPDVEIAGPVAVCSDGTSIYQVSAQTNTSYEWRLTSTNGSIASGQGTSNITVGWGAPETATIRLVVRDELTGCTDSATYEVTVGSELKPVITGPDVICAGGSIELDAGDGYTSYQWSTGETTRTITVDQAMLVAVTVRDGSGCQGTSNPFEITMKAPLEVKLTPGGNLRLCEGDEQEIAAPSGYASYIWSTGETRESILVDAEGEYWVEVVDSDGCTGMSDTVRVVRIEDAIEITPSGDLSLCEGDSLTLNAPPGYVSYAWSTKETTESIVVRAAGEYWVRVTAMGGCELYSDTARVHVVSRPAKPIVTRSGDTLISSTAVSYQWMRDGTEIIGATNQRYVIDRPGTYSVRIANVEGCSAESDGVEGSSRHVVWLDTVEGNVGDLLWLTMHIAPPLSASENVSNYRAWLRLDPEALYPHETSSGSGAVAGDADMKYDGYGAIEVERGEGGSAIEGGALFRLAVRGLVTGRPTNIVAIDSVVIGGVGKIAVAEPGLAILHGCELGQEFGKPAEIVSITPNPGDEEIEVVYRTPVGMEVTLRLLDAVGHVVTEQKLGAGSGEVQRVRVELHELDSGLYMVELRDAEEVVAAPLLIRR